MTVTGTEQGPAGGSILGTRVQRIEDPALLRGRGTYIDNVAPTDAVHVAFVRAFTAHGRIESVDTSDAAAMPGVVGVFTGTDRSEEHTSELQSLMRLSYAVFCLKKQNK